MSKGTSQGTGEGYLWVSVGDCFLDGKCLLGEAFFARMATAVMCLVSWTERTAYKVHVP